MKAEGWMPLAALLAAALPVLLSVLVLWLRWRAWNRRDSYERKARAIASARLGRSYPICKHAPSGWFCTRERGHAGPCAAWPNDPRMMP